jgi:DNA (cytosine-5)-methyltransferase 1
MPRQPKPDSTSASCAWKVLDLFSGCGGLAEGFRLSGERGEGAFRCIGAVDNWDAACDAFSRNHDVQATCDGVTPETVGRILDASGGADIVVGGPPCQGFSTSGKRALDDPRNSLVRSYFNAVRQASPRAFLMENVSGFTTFQGGMILKEVVEVARELGYRVFPGVVLASLCGVPQRRRRFFLVGLRSGGFRFPLQKTAIEGDGRMDLFGRIPETEGCDLIVDQRPGDGVERWTFDDATSDLPAIEAGEGSTEYASAPQNAYQAWAREGDMVELADHVACGHRPDFVEMMRYVPPGRSAMDEDILASIPERIRPGKGFPNSYARIRGDEPSPTITRNFTTPSSANCIHPRCHRSLTLREGARCQSFPDRYRFSGSHGDRRLMIGNAVPPLLAKAMGECLLRALHDETAGKNAARTAAVVR